MAGSGSGKVEEGTWKGLYRFERTAGTEAGEEVEYTLTTLLRSEHFEERAMGGYTELYKDTWYLEDNGVRIFLAAGTEKALVIDTGMSGVDIHKAAKEVTDLPLMK